MKILLVAFADSVHTVRWIQQFAGLGWDFHLVPSIQSRLPHRELRDVTLHDLFRHDLSAQGATVRQSSWLPFPFRQGRTKAATLLSRVTGGRLSHPARIARLVRRLKPDLVHAMELQQAGYMTAEAKLGYARWAGSRAGAFPPMVLSCWGNDIYHFQHLPEHREPLRRTIEACDYFHADCDRDIALAKSFGLRGEVGGVFPVVGGYDLAAMRRGRQPGPPSARRLVVIKGYSGDGKTGHPYGKAWAAIRACRLCADVLKAGNYEVAVHSWAWGVGVREEADAITKELGVKFNFLPPLPNTQIIELMGRARVGIGLSVSDGTPNAMLEAMVMGALPIQSDTVSTAEWIRHGENGFLTPAEDVEAVASALRRALTDDALVDAADPINARLVERVDRSVVWPMVKGMYERAAARGRSDGG